MSLKGETVDASLILNRENPLAVLPSHDTSLNIHETSKLLLTKHEVKFSNIKTF